MALIRTYPTGGQQGAQVRMGQQLIGTPQCPYCGVARPQMNLQWQSTNPISSANGPPRRWATYACTTCGGVLLVMGAAGDGSTNALIDKIIPEPKRAHADLPEQAARYLDQAYQTLAAPDAAAVMAGSAVDAMLKSLGLTDGSVYARINQARDQHLLTADMAEWAHSVRLGANRPRHADAENPHVSPDEAAQSVEFAEALGNFLFVLSARVRRGIAASSAAQ
jgi:Domain of unknown function (DUF4145)